MVTRAPWLALWALGGCIPAAGVSVYDPSGDFDHDGVANADDCDPADPAVGVGTPGHADDDGDGFGTIGVVAACGAVVEDATDCDDGNAAINPVANEACGNAIGENCDGLAPMCRWSGEQAAGVADVRVHDPDLTDVTALGAVLTDDGVGATRRAVGLGGRALASLRIDGDPGSVRSEQHPITLPAMASAFPGRVVGVGNVDRVDGDPYDELALAVDDPSSSDVWIVAGPVDGDIAVASIGATVLYGAAGTGFGAAIAPVGDVDGDRQDDFVVGAPGAANGAGCAWIVHGGAALTAGGQVDVGSVAGEVCGDEYAAAFGSVVGGVGDIDADGLDDFAAVGLESSPDTAFQLAVFRGDGTAIVTYYEGFDSQGNTGFAHRVAFAGVGDVSGDGRDDLAVGMPWVGDNGAGEVVIVDHVAAISADYGNVVMAGAGWRNLLGLDPSYGTHVVALGDVQGDDGADFAVSAPGLEVGGTDRVGAVYVYDGAVIASEPLLDDPSEPLVDPSVALARFGSDGSPGFGGSLAGVGDVNNDGWNDLAIGSDVGSDVFLGGTR